jgi:hypothetical protein
VDQEQVDLLQLQLLQRLVERGTHDVGVVAVVVQLGGDEHLVTRQPGRRDRGADTRLVPVHLSRVDVPVAQLEGLGDAVLRRLRRDLPRAVAELGNLDAVVEGDHGNGHAPHANGGPWGAASRRCE